MVDDDIPRAGEEILAYLIKMLSPQKHICNMTFVSRFSVKKSLPNGHRLDRALEAGGNSGRGDCICQDRASLAPGGPAELTSPGPSLHCLQVS